MFKMPRKVTKFLLERKLRKRRAKLDTDAWRDVVDVLTDSYKAGKWELTSALAHLVAVRRSKRLNLIYRPIKHERVVELLTPSKRTIDVALGGLCYTGSIGIDTEIRTAGDVKMLVVRVSLLPHMLEQTPTLAASQSPKKRHLYAVK